MSDTPIYDQLRREYAGAELFARLADAIENFRESVRLFVAGFVLPAAYAEMLRRERLNAILERNWAARPGAMHQLAIVDESAAFTVSVGGRAAGKTARLAELREIHEAKTLSSERTDPMNFTALRQVFDFGQMIADIDAKEQQRRLSAVRAPRGNPVRGVRKLQTRSLARNQLNRGRR